jgi:hypothetical protein
VRDCDDDNGAAETDARVGADACSSADAEKPKAGVRGNIRCAGMFGDMRLGSVYRGQQARTMKRGETRPA